MASFPRPVAITADRINYPNKTIAPDGNTLMCSLPKGNFDPPQLSVKLSVKILKEY